MKGDTEVVLMIAAFVIGATLMAYAEEISMLPYIQSLSGPFATLIAAFVGAWYAYKLQLAHLEKERTKDQVEAGNRAIFELGRTYNKFNAIKQQFIEEHRNNSARHVLILPMAGDIEALEFNFDSLSFLVDSEDPNLLGKLAMFEQEVASTLGVIEQRSHMHVEVVQPAVESLEQKTGELMLVEQIEKELGTRYAKTLKMLTDYMIDGVDRVVSMAEHHIEELNNILHTKYPGHKIIGFITPNTANPADSQTRG